MRTCLLLALASFTAGVAADATAADAGPTSATAADAAAPILELSIADGASLIADAQASLFGQVWNDPVMAPLRAHSATAVAVAMAEMPNGLDPMSVLTAANHVGLRMMDRPVADLGGSATQADERDDFMAFAIQGDFVASAAAVFAAIPA